MREYLFLLQLQSSFQQIIAAYLQNVTQVKENQNTLMAQSSGSACSFLLSFLMTYSINSEFVRNSD